jgi:hypothetical protein
LVERRGVPMAEWWDDLCSQNLDLLLGGPKAVAMDSRTVAKRALLMAGQTVDKTDDWTAARKALMSASTRVARSAVTRAAHSVASTEQCWAARTVRMMVAQRETQRATTRAAPKVPRWAAERAEHWAAY